MVWQTCKLFILCWERLKNIIKWKMWKKNHFLGKLWSSKIELKKIKEKILKRLFFCCFFDVRCTVIARKISARYLNASQMIYAITSVAYDGIRTIQWYIKVFLAFQAKFSFFFVYQMQQQDDIHDLLLHRTALKQQTAKLCLFWSLSACQWFLRRSNRWFRFSSCMSAA